MSVKSMTSSPTMTIISIIWCGTALAALAVFPLRILVHYVFPFFSARLSSNMYPRIYAIQGNNWLEIPTNLSNIICALAFITMAAALYHTAKRGRPIWSEFHYMLFVSYAFVALGCFVVSISNLILMYLPWYWANLLSLACLAILATVCALITLQGLEHMSGDPGVLVAEIETLRIALNEKHKIEEAITKEMETTFANGILARKLLEAEERLENQRARIENFLQQMESTAP